MNEISCKITSSFLQYVRSTKPEFIPELLKDLPYDEAFLSDPDNWISWDVERLLEDRLETLYDDETIMFTIGRSVKSLKSVGVVNTVMNLFLSPERIIRYSPTMARFFTKDVLNVNVLESGKGHATVELRIKGKQTRGACLFNQGLFSLASELFGLGPTEVTEVQCMVPLAEVGKYRGLRLKVDGDGTVREYHGGEKHGVPLGSLSERGTFKVHGTDFGTESCIYRLKWREKGAAADTGGREKAFEEALRHLEENHAKLEKAYDRIYRSEERYRALIDNASDIIVFLDEQGIVRFVNRKGVELLGYPASELQGRSVFDFIDEPFREESRQRLGARLKGESPVAEIVVRRRNGGRLVLSVNSTPISEDGTEGGVMIIARDITTEREMAARLLEAERFAAKGIVAAEIAHEINNSLASIETALFIVNNIRVERPYRQDLLKDMKEEIERVSSIVKGILDVYRADTTAVQTVDLNAEAGKVATITQRRLKGKGISIATRLAANLSSLSCYPGHIKQVLLNLIKNAEEAIPRDRAGSIEIRTAEDASFLYLAVGDTGLGMPAEKLARAAEQFFTTKAGGTGLGLSVCREIARRYGGELKIESVEGEGTTVTVSFRKG